MALSETTYSVQTTRSGQPRAYADTEREYLITVKSTRHGSEGLGPWLFYGNLDRRIADETKARAEGRLVGGETPEQLRSGQRKWALGLVRALCQNFREKDDQDGRSGMEAHFYPTLKSLVIDQQAATIRALIIEPYAD